MSSYFKLIDAIDTPMKINVARRENGIVKYCHVQLTPGKKYELGDDEVFINSLRSVTTQKSYSKELVSILESYGVPYEEKFCRTCGGKVKKIAYNVVEVVEE